MVGQADGEQAEPRPFSYAQGEVGGACAIRTQAFAAQWFQPDTVSSETESHKRWYRTQAEPTQCQVADEQHRPEPVEGCASAQASAAQWLRPDTVSNETAFSLTQVGSSAERRTLHHFG